ncbi:unnamed protein product [Fusarium venenatum]|uniref:Uncharacterized protein n=1 Tax=Fusarium venenatum TaxID=56646 RepID=A0A2L2TBJ4_9HYPO|nr:uncharacterized protein FVRRES_07157 [Fusarium venenatum]CEI62721.1 unnamed protein product [Fusarium venenatum]
MYENGASPNAQKGDCMNTLALPTCIGASGSESWLSSRKFRENRACRALVIVVHKVRAPGQVKTLNFAKVPNDVILLRLSD